MPIQLIQPKLANRQHHAPRTTDHAFRPLSGGSETEEALGLGAFSGLRTGKASREEVLACDAIDINCGLADVAVLRVLGNEREESAGSASLVRKQGSLC